MKYKNPTGPPLTKISKFEYPLVLFRFPGLIHAIYQFNFILQLRKWHVLHAIKHMLRSATNPGTWIDIGCGEGQYLIPISKAFPAWKTIGIDNNTSNIQFLRKVAPANTSLILSDIGTSADQNKADIITCVGVLQYIANDDAALQNIASMLQPNGKFLLYSPVNGRLHLSLYKYLLNRYEHYETINDRKRIYQEDALMNKLVWAGFRIQNIRFTYGYCGRISHEIQGIFILSITSAPVPIRLMASILFVPVIPLTLLLMLIDYCIKHRSGNGILLTATINS